MPYTPADQPLTPPEARVLATLMEKARTVPDTYPLTLLGIVTGCNQKTSREPVMTLSDTEAQDALDSLKTLGLVNTVSGGRTTRWEHHFQKGVGVPEQSAVLLGLLILRGPQTAAELRLNAERWYRFADVSSVEGFLNELQERSAEKGGPLTILLPKAPGAREARWAHLLCGPVQADTPMRSSTENTTATAQRLATLEAQVAHLQATVERLCQELGLPPAPVQEP
jgi:uncharacterized protein YceH (UPF0502 family)